MTLLEFRKAKQYYQEIAEEYGQQVIEKKILNRFFKVMAKDVPSYERNRNGGTDKISKQKDMKMVEMISQNLLLPQKLLSNCLWYNFEFGKAILTDSLMKAYLGLDQDRFSEFWQEKMEEIINHGYCEVSLPVCTIDEYNEIAMDWFKKFTKTKKFKPYEKLISKRPDIYYSKDRVWGRMKK